jgi:hypothetical protein
MMQLLLRLAVIALAVLVLYWILAGRSSSSKSKFKCSTCRHCGRLDSDGVICRFGRKQTFKNPVHIQNCTDYERAS